MENFERCERKGSLVALILAELHIDLRCPVNLGFLSADSFDLQDRTMEII